jgi:hypothetical protein
MRHILPLRKIVLEVTPSGLDTSKDAAWRQTHDAEVGVGFRSDSFFSRGKRQNP